MSALEERLPRWLTPEQVADIFGVSRAYVMERVAKREWPHQRPAARLIRFTPGQVEQIQRLTEQAATAGADKPIGLTDRSHARRRRRSA